MPRPRNTPEVLWSKVDVRSPDECWPWIGWRNGKGYGRFEIDGKSYYAHRAIFDLANPGLIPLSAPPSMHAFGFIRHSCDNPSCCNPAHLLIGTHQDNMTDKIVRGRSKWCESSVMSPRAKLTAEAVRSIRHRHRAGRITRQMLADEYEVSLQTIKAALSRRHYADIADA